MEVEVRDLGWGEDIPRAREQGGSKDRSDSFLS